MSDKKNKKAPKTSKTVVYGGTSDFQEFGPEDFAKVDIEVDENEVFSFPRGVEVAVSDEVAEALLNDDPEKGIFHDFEFTAGEDVELSDDPESEGSSEGEDGASSNTPPTSSGSSQSVAGDTNATGGSGSTPRP